MSVRDPGYETPYTAEQGEQFGAMVADDVAFRPRTGVGYYGEPVPFAEGMIADPEAELQQAYRSTTYEAAYDTAGYGSDELTDIDGFPRFEDEQVAAYPFWTTPTATTTTRSIDSLYCFALMQSTGYEVGLVTKLREHGVSVFACDAWSVYSDKAMQITAGNQTFTTKNIGSMHCEYGGPYTLALNTEIFVRGWRMVFIDAIFLAYSWTVKVDPDCVFLPKLLRIQVRSVDPDYELYLNNCDQGLHGPIEVMSRAGMISYQHGIDDCLRNSTIKRERTLWGEDVFLRHCLSMLQIRKIDDFHLLSEPACLWENPAKDGCTSGKVSYHPFKQADEYFKCLAQAEKARPQTDVDTTTTRLTTTTVDPKKDPERPLFLPEEPETTADAHA